MKDLESIMAINSLSGKKFLTIVATAVLGFGVAASFIVPTANASQNAPTQPTVVVAGTSSASETPNTEAPDTTGTDAEVAAVDCNNGLDATGAQCDGGPSANPLDNSVDVQDGSENTSETASSVDGDNVQN